MQVGAAETRTVSNRYRQTPMHGGVSRIGQGIDPDSCRINQWKKPPAAKRIFWANEEYYKQTNYEEEFFDYKT